MKDLLRRKGAQVCVTSPWAVELFDLAATAEFCLP